MNKIEALIVVCMVITIALLGHLVVFEHARASSMLRYAEVFVELQKNDEVLQSRILDLFTAYVSATVAQEEINEPYDEPYDYETDTYEMETTG